MQQLPTQPPVPPIQQPPITQPTEPPPQIPQPPEPQSTQNLESSIPVSSAQGSNKIYLLIGLLVGLIAIIVGYSLINKNTAPSYQTTKQIQVSTTPQPTITTPAISPVTPSNADQTLNSTQTNIQQSMDQADTDLKQMDSINSSSDNPSNL